jgi:hypothetical protein
MVVVSSSKEATERVPFAPPAVLPPTEPITSRISERKSLR